MSKLNLSNIVHAVVSSDAHDQYRQRELFSELIRESERARAYGQIEIDFLLEVSIELTRFMADGEPLSLEDVQRLLTRVLVHAECKAHRYVEGLGQAAPVKGSALQSKLSDEGPETGEVHESSDGEPTEATPPEHLHLCEGPGESQETPSPLPSLTSAPSGSSPSLRLVSGGEPTLTESPDLRRVKLGEVLSHLGLANASQIDRALLDQDESKQRIGDVLSRLGQLRPIELRSALALHAKAREYADKRVEGEEGDEVHMPFRQWHETLLGEVLLSADAITSDQLKDAIKIQRATGHLLGEILVQRKMCDTRTVLEGIRLQEKLRSTCRPEPST